MSDDGSNWLLLALLGIGAWAVKLLLNIREKVFRLEGRVDEHDRWERELRKKEDE